MTRGTGKHSQLFYTVLALAFSLILGLGMRFLGGAPLQEGVAQWLLTPLKTVYLNALKLTVAPVVFFSVAGSVAGISDYKAYGRIGMKVVGLYLVTSLVASCIGVGTACLLHPGAGGIPEQMGHYNGTVGEISLLDTLVNIVPTDLVTPFQEANMIQVIFLAVVFGAASGVLEQKSGISQFRKGLELLHRLFVTIASGVLKLIPLGTFAAVALLIVEIDLTMVGHLIKLMGCVLVGALGMMLFYGIMFLAATRQSPLKLLKKCLPNLASFALFCSTSAVLPQTLDTCVNRIGINREVASFAIPLGSTINMDGACIYLTISALFLAELYGVNVTVDMLAGVVLTTLLLSVGAPPMPGSGFICLSVLVLQLGLPMDSIGLLLGIDQLMSVCRTVVNGLGDMVCVTVIAWRQGEVDPAVFQE